MLQSMRLDNSMITDLECNAYTIRDRLCRHNEDTHPGVAAWAHLQEEWEHWDNVSFQVNQD